MEPSVMQNSPPNNTAVFRPEVFEVQSFDQAKRIIVTPEIGTTTEERWTKETAYLLDDIPKFLSITEESWVLDYGCGIGRISKGLIEKFGCRVVGVDASKSMRLMAPEYVLSERFVVWSPETFDAMVAKGFRANGAICLWVIQHVLRPQEDIARIKSGLAENGRLYSLNQNIRCVPTDKGWANDGYDVRSGLCQALEEVEFHKLPAEATTPTLANASMIQVLQKR
jgi:2-polyprenyl-3-methyl-5-hydroxy-6-metoxy-1,4-benzoquinol methylase